MTGKVGTMIKLFKNQAYLICGILFLSPSVQAEGQLSAKGVELVRVRTSSGDIRVRLSDGEIITLGGALRFEKVSTQGSGANTPRALKNVGSRATSKPARMPVDLQNEASTSVVAAIFGRDNRKYARMERDGSKLSIKSHSRPVVLGVPAGLRIELKSRSGDIVVEVPSENLEVRTVSGDIRLQAPSKDAELEAVSGEIEVEADVDVLRLSAISGDVEIEGSSKEAKLTTTSGDIEWQGEYLPSRLKIRTVSGDVELDGALPKSFDYEMKSVSGDFELNRTNRNGFQIDLVSRTGDLHLPRGEHQVEVEDDCWKNCRVRQIVDGGGGKIRFESFSGDFDVAR